ncbi:MAG: hypothetical protein JNM07_04845 [Phycisphaerae bacterium]|nr:hypothetical protein [Phycisphaerae bacterium]
MILSLIALGIAGGIAYIWSARGFFSALMHMVVVIFAGAAAFAVWEPVAYMLIEKGDQWIVDLSWGIALAVPFTVILTSVRLGLDKAVPKNVAADQVVDMVGGGLCGAVSGTITAGIVILSLSSMKLGTDMIVGFSPMSYDATGNLVRRNGLLYPVDRLTAGFYSFLSNGTLSTPTPLARWRPGLQDEGALLRTSFENGTAKSIARPGDFKLLGRYTVARAKPVANLFKDDQQAREQQIRTIDNEAVTPNGSYLDAYVLNFNSGAREAGGFISIGAGQVRLVCVPEEGSGPSIGLQPIAVISRAAGDSLDLGRWRYDAREVYIASAGGAADSRMAFEFAVPRGHVPLALYVKSVRVNVGDVKPFAEFAAPEDRDFDVRSKDLLVKAAASETIQGSGATVTVNESFVRVTNGIGGNLIFNAGDKRGIEINDKNRIIGGEAKFTVAELAKASGIDRALQIRSFASSYTNSIIQVDVSGNSPFSLAGDAAAGAEGAPALIDALGQRYPAVGFLFKNKQIVHLRMRVDAPITSLSELPTISRSAPDNNLVLIFRPDLNVEIVSFVIGNKEVAKFDTPIKVGQQK